MMQTPARILIVDDERQNRQLLEVLLTAEGYLLDTASSAAEALVLVAQRRPDLILLDVMMPGMDGYQLVALLSAHPDTARIPVVMLTALDDRNSRSHGLTAGAVAFLTKPIDRAALHQTLKALLGPKPTRPGESSTPGEAS
jgi:CheY-like chemotaxis protein